MARQFTTKYALIGQIIAKEREQQGFDQKTFAEQSRISQPTLSRIERGETVIDIEQLEKAASALHMKPEEVLERANTMANHMEQWGVEVIDREAAKQRSKGVGTALIGGALAGFILAMLVKR